MRIPIVIPSYEPDDNLIKLCADLSAAGLTDWCIVDDGSGDAYRRIFDEIEETYHCPVLRHEVNRGKGRGLKTAFAYLLEHGDPILGCVTADSDGQHSPEDIQKIAAALEAHPEDLILGVRDFYQDDVPNKSRFGNVLTRNVFRYLCGVGVSDTQTGLRGIPADFMRELLDVAGERFEFETNMLVVCGRERKITEVSIATIYESKTDHKSHYRPFRDSLPIIGIFGKIFFKFVLSSLSASILDLALFWVFSRLFRSWSEVFHVTVATVLARVISAIYNYLVNYKLVFRSNKKAGGTAVRYFLLAAVQMCVSAGLVTVFAGLLGLRPELAVKIVIDVILFLVSYWVQRKFIF